MATVLLSSLNNAYIRKRNGLIGNTVCLSSILLYDLLTTYHGQRGRTYGDRAFTSDVLPVAIIVAIDFQSVPTLVGR